MATRKKTPGTEATVQTPPAPLTQEQMIEKFKNASTTRKPTSTPTPPPTPTATDEVPTMANVILTNNRSLQIKSTKIKYFRGGEFGMYKLVKQIGLVEFLHFKDSDQALGLFLSAVLDKPYERKQVKQEDDTYEEELQFDPLVTELLDEMTIADIENVINAALRVNKIDPLNFQSPPMTD